MKQEKFLKDLILSFDAKKENIATIFREYIDTGETSRDIVGTPKRFLKAFEEMTSGYSENPEDYLITFPIEDTETNQIHLTATGNFVSLCEHHLLPFTGKWAIYIEQKNKVLGLSKYTRIVKCFAKRLQLQEKLTAQIFNFLWDNLKPEKLIVVLNATHGCVACRGVEELNNETLAFCGREVLKFNTETEEGEITEIVELDSLPNFVLDKVKNK
jgi:GTP cyclohydrolase I